MHKQGKIGEQVMIVVLVLFIVIVGGGIFAGVVMFYGSEIDAREVEVQILTYKIERCLSEGSGMIDENLFYNECGIFKKFFENNKVYFKITKNGGINGEIFYGSNFEACNFIGAKENKHYPTCIKKEIKKGNDKFEIIVASNHWNKKEVVV